MTTTDQSPLANYFSCYEDNILGSDPFDFDNAWDADLHPDEYGDQSGVVGNSWDDDEDDFSISDDDGSCSEGDDDKDDETSFGPERAKTPRPEEWSFVYAASFTVVASATTTSSKRVVCQAGEEKCSLEESESSPSHQCPSNPLTSARRNSRVRFCEQPPMVVSYERCSRDQHSQLFYSCHELQKIIDEMRLELKNTSSNSAAPTWSAVHKERMAPTCRSV